MRPTRAEWNDGPANGSRPAMSGKLGRLSWPTALTSAFASIVSSRRRGCGPSTSTSPSSSSNSAREHLGAEADVRAQVEVVGAGAEVVEQHVLGAELLRPVVALRERVAVEVVGHVDPAPGVAVLEPRAADVVVLLEDTTRDAGLAEPVGGDEARHAGADDRRRRNGRSGVDVVLAPARRAESSPASASSSTSSVKYESDTAAGGELDHRPQRRRDPRWAPRRSGRRAARRSVSAASSAGGTSLLTRAIPPLGSAQSLRVGPQIVSQQRKVAGGLRERGQQRGRRCDPHHGLDRGVVEGGEELFGRGAHRSGY